jgi:hypothetical protein
MGKKLQRAPDISFSGASANAAIDFRRDVFGCARQLRELGCRGNLK